MTKQLGTEDDPGPGRGHGHRHEDGHEDGRGHGTGGRPPGAPAPAPEPPRAPAPFPNPGPARTPPVAPGAAPAPAPASAPPENPHPVDPPGPQTDRLVYLDAATRRIARGMNVDETVTELCDAAVPEFADAAVVHLYTPLPGGDEGAAQPQVLRLRSAAPPAVCSAGPVCPVDAVRPDPEGELARLLRVGRPVFGDTPGLGPVVDQLLEGAESARLGRRLILAPLHGRSLVMGSVALLRDPDRPRFTYDDLLVASQLATHTALGIHKAVLYAREAAVADALQRAMLPPSLPEPTGVALASRYLPASRTAQVGGDWYDAIPLPGNRVALVIGDVMGHSMASAAIMGQLRTTVQTLAGLDLSPDEILHHLDEQAERLGSDHTATCVYAMYDPVLHRLLISNAGHLPPVLLHPDGTTEVVELPPGAPIGVGSGGFESVELAAPAGSVLLLYTDGLVESRDADFMTGVDRLCERLRHGVTDAAVTPSLQALCDRALGALGGVSRDDDIAILAARFEGILPDTVAYWYLAPRPQTAAQARRLTRRTLRQWDLEQLLESTELLVSEVVGNAVRFAHRPITLRLLRTDVLRCEVEDDSTVVPRMRHARLSDEGGRGLFLVDQLAQRWGATRVSTGKVVWFELPLPGSPGRRDHGHDRRGGGHPR